MVDITAMMGIASSLKTAGEIVQTMLGLKEAAAIQSKVIELNGVILSAQQSAMASNLAQTELVNRIRDLEAELAQVKNWEAEKQRYQLTELPPGIFVYMLKPEMASGETPHKLCTTCFNAGKKSFLQSRSTTRGQTPLKCVPCNVEFFVGHYVTPQVRTQREDGW